MFSKFIQGIQFFEKQIYKNSQRSIKKKSNRFYASKIQFSWHKSYNGFKTKTT